MNAIVTEGLICAPERCPVAWTMTLMISPNTRLIPTEPSAQWYWALVTLAPHPGNTSGERGEAFAGAVRSHPDEPIFVAFFRHQQFSASSPAPVMTVFNGWPSSPGAFGI